jgi:hypothetical protein
VRRSPVCRPALLAAALAVAAFADGGRSAAASDAAADLRRAEAKARFDRGMKLLEERDDAGALAELRRAQELSPERQTLLMIGVLYGTMNRPVEALAALDRVLEQAAALSPEQRTVARQRREEQARKVGYLRVVVSAPAAIEIDGIEAGRAPDQAAIPVAAGAHLVAALSPGHVPARKEVLVAGGVTEELRFDLVPSEMTAVSVYSAGGQLGVRKVALEAQLARYTPAQRVPPGPGPGGAQGPGSAPGPGPGRGPSSSGARAGSALTAKSRVARAAWRITRA